MAIDERNAAPPSLRGAERRSNPDCFRGNSLDCFASLATTKGRRFRRPDRMKVIGLAGWSGAGKTTLLTRVIPLLNEQGLSVSVIKHAHHKFDVDVPGKD